MEQEKELPQNIIKRVLDTLKGQSVVARRDSDGLYYPGVIFEKICDQLLTLWSFDEFIGSVSNY